MDTVNMAEELDVSGQNLGPEGAKTMAVFIKNNGALTLLNLSENELCGIEDGDGEYDASGVTALADAIGKHQ